MSEPTDTTEAANGQSRLTAGLGVKSGDGDTVAVGHDGKPWPQTIDAMAWADEFCKRNSAADHGTMLAWFANAIMLGYDTAIWKEQDKCVTPNVKVRGDASRRPA